MAMCNGRDFNSRIRGGSTAKEVTQVGKATRQVTTHTSSTCAAGHVRVAMCKVQTINT